MASIWFASQLIYCSLGFLIFALAVLALAFAAGQAGKVAYSSMVAIIQLRSLYIQNVNDLNNNQVLAELQQKELALTLRHRDIMLEVEADTARMPIRKERLGLLAEVEKVES